MKETEFKPGDVVQMKSGGPWMTVVSRPYGERNVTVRVQYFDNGKLFTANFNSAVLKHVHRERSFD